MSLAPSRKIMDSTTSSFLYDIFVFTNFIQGNVLASAPHPAGPY
jgi:hypothetical protein